MILHLATNANGNSPFILLELIVFKLLKINEQKIPRAAADGIRYRYVGGSRQHDLNVFAAPKYFTYHQLAKIHRAYLSLIVSSAHTFPGLLTLFSNVLAQPTTCSDTHLCVMVPIKHGASRSRLLTGFAHTLF